VLADKIKRNGLRGGDFLRLSTIHAANPKAPRKGCSPAFCVIEPIAAWPE
jgi:hypothetical protein